MDESGICRHCGEFKRVILTVGLTSERRPAPVYKYECKVCGNKWAVDENIGDSDGGRFGAIH